MKRFFCILCILCLMIGLAPQVQAANISQETLDIMLAVGGDSQNEFNRNWIDIESGYSQMEQELHSYAYRDYYYGRDGTAKDKYLEFLEWTGMISQGETVSNQRAYDLLRQFRNSTAHITDDLEGHYQALAKYRGDNQMGAASLFDANGGSLQMGSLLIGALGGLLVGMGLMALITKKKTVKN